MAVAGQIFPVRNPRQLFLIWRKALINIVLDRLRKEIEIPVYMPSRVVNKKQ